MSLGVDNKNRSSAFGLGDTKVVPADSKPPERTGGRVGFMRTKEMALPSAPPAELDPEVWAQKLADLVDRVLGRYEALATKMKSDPAAVTVADIAQLAALIESTRTMVGPHPKALHPILSQAPLDLSYFEQVSALMNGHEDRCATLDRYSLHQAVRRGAIREVQALQDGLAGLAGECMATIPTRVIAARIVTDLQGQLAKLKSAWSDLAGVLSTEKLDDPESRSRGLEALDRYALVAADFQAKRWDSDSMVTDDRQSNTAMLHLMDVLAGLYASSDLTMLHGLLVDGGHWLPGDWGMVDGLERALRGIYNADQALTAAMSVLRRAE